MLLYPRHKKKFVLLTIIDISVITFSITRVYFSAGEISVKRNGFLDFDFQCNALYSGVRC
jgi:hypothetical protein